MSIVEMIEPPEHAVAISDDWRISAQAGKVCGDPKVWIRVETGGLSGGTFADPEKARELARAILAAASEVAPD